MEVYYSLPWALRLVTGGTLLEPYGRDSPPFLGSSQSHGEMITTCLVASRAKQCPEQGVASLPPGCQRQYWGSAVVGRS